MNRLTNYREREERVLRLPLKAEYFDAIKSGEKKYEYRLCNDYWEKRLLGKGFDRMELTKGYPKRGDAERTLHRPWFGWVIEWVRHPHFGPVSVQVFAIRVN